jgi:hypothetical protein
MLMTGIYKMAKNLKIGTKIVTLQAFDPVGPEFEVLHYYRIQMTWGMTGITIYNKIA